MNDNYNPSNYTGIPIVTELVAEEASALNFFAAHAPNEIPSWFTHTQPPQPKLKSESIDNLQPDDKEDVKKWMDCMLEELPEHLQWYKENMDYNNKATSEWNRLNDEERYFQWRCYYAIKMIAHLNKTTTP